jgi:hypothetical protein
LKIDKYVKDLYNKIESFSSSATNCNDGNDFYDGNNQGKDAFWFCGHCNKTHLELDECSQALFGEGDRWCISCNRVHRDYVNMQLTL